MCLHLLKTIFLQFTQQIIHKLSSSFVSGLYLFACTFILRVLKKSFNYSLAASRIALMQPLNKTTAIAKTMAEYTNSFLSLASEFKQSKTSDLVSPKYRGTTVPLSRSQQRMRGTLVMREAPMVRVPHLGPLISTSSVENNCRMNSAAAARTALTYLKIVPKKPGFCSDEKMLWYWISYSKRLVFKMTGTSSINFFSAVQKSWCFGSFLLE